MSDPQRYRQRPLYEVADVNVYISLGMTLGFLLLCLATVWWIFRTGYRLKN